MADHRSRKSAAASRLRAKLKKSKESLADEFEFKMFVIITFQNEAKKNAVFEIDLLHPMMTNDYEQSIMEGVEKNAYSADSSMDLLSRDVVQLHARKWRCKRRDVIGCPGGIDFMIWPRNDVQSIRCQLFS